jgi:hypothetical protein
MRIDQVFQSDATRHYRRVRAWPDKLSTGVNGPSEPTRSLRVQNKKATPAVLATPRGLAETFMGGPDNASVRKCGNGPSRRAPPPRSSCDDLRRHKHGPRNRERGPQ